MSEPLLEEPAIGPQADRNAEIVKRVTSGMSRQVVADELGLTRQRVSQIVIRATGADHQPRHDPWPEERGQRLRATPRHADPRDHQAGRHCGSRLTDLGHGTKTGDTGAGTTLPLDRPGRRR